MPDAPLQARVHTLNGCRRDHSAPAPINNFPTITAAVGQGGANRPDDTREIQKALNRIPYLTGGPWPELKVDGLVGPKTIGAITRFQAFHFGEDKADGRVDTDKYTIARLRQMNRLVDDLGGIGTTAFWTGRKPIRMVRMHFGLVEARSATAKGRRTLESAMDHLRGQPDSFGFNAKAFARADLHFALGKLDADRQFTALGQIRASFISVQIAIDNQGKGLPGIPNGADIFEIDPLNNPRDAAYSPVVSIDHSDRGVDAYKVYLCDGIDACTTDHFNHILIHELFHATDVETPATEIGDHGYREDALRLPHHLRMRNADNYALFATHCHIGRARLVASQPALAAHIPAEN